MFYGCLSLADISSLENWSVLNGYEFDNMFSDCSKLKDIKLIEKWKSQSLSKYVKKQKNHLKKKSFFNW